MAAKPNILEILAKRIIIGDGSYMNTFEKRGYVTAGLYTPECVLEHPDAVSGLHKEFARAGADVMQAFTFHATDGMLQCSESAKNYNTSEINRAACDLARNVATSYNLLVCGGLSPTPTYTAGKGKAAVQAEFEKQCQVFKEKDVDFFIAEFFCSIEEIEWAIDVMKKYNKPIACTMRIGPVGCMDGISAGECAVRMAKRGADIVGLNCQFDYNAQLKTMKLMKDALNEAGLSPFLMMQPIGFLSPETEYLVEGYSQLPEYLLAMEPRILTRWECRDYARKAYELGVRYIGGCCGFESYHIREMAEELSEERGFRPPGKDHNLPFAAGYGQSVYEHDRQKHGRDYWMNLIPKTGRPNSAAYNSKKELIHL
ncbi:S-methylmethionine--homocysteine S-methyltransferase BHMT2-like [Tubulanus polymorphus]|uniref:S-methylmethionine--homocysteine S-methyltransferase BHMT2-like n=1 Tax=Tubulanus polymorphus TaxID=672921 RepID=UPI003DA48F37